MEEELSEGGSGIEEEDLVTPPAPKTWAVLRDEVRTVRRRLWAFTLRLPHSFLFRRLGGMTRIYFMATPPQSQGHSRENSVFAIDVTDPDKTPSPSLSSSTQQLPWLQILPAGFQGSGIPSKEEQLLLERKRMTPSGIAAYQFHEHSAKFVFSASSTLFQCVDNDTTNGLSPIEIKTPLTEGARLNADICPGNAELIAFVNKGDIWVVHSSSDQEVQLTFSHDEEKEGEEKVISSGIPSYIMQEEFNRFLGFWWQPTANSSHNGVYRLLYEEVDESGVNIATLLTLPGREAESYRFPVPGTPNAKSTLKLLQVEVKGGRIGRVERSELHVSIRKHFPWAEYIVRVGWTPDGDNIWVQLLDRRQQRLQLILIPLILPGNEVPNAPFYVIHSESSENWINVNDGLTFLPSPDSSRTRFLWASEETGFRHLYLIEAELRPAITQPWNNVPHPTLHLTPSLISKKALTEGDWEVMEGVAGIHSFYGFFFFIGLKDTPMERHLYVGSMTTPPVQIKRLTKPGFSYSAVLNPDCTLVVLTFSSTQIPPSCELFSINYGETSSVDSLQLTPLTYFVKPMSVEPGFPFPEICSYRLTSGEELYVMIYRPMNFDPKKKYPTVLNVYGGPEVQLVYNSFRGTGQLWLYLLVSQGYCVVAVDSRGSHNRGVKFESHIRGRMGTVELKDQVEVLSWLSTEQGFVDTSRVGIYGWSYGGYLSLMGLAHYPHVFKVAVAGAPVTSWELYDTGYTERYMDLPSNNPLGYAQGSVLSYISSFPDEEDRLLIIHGLLDENVHFTHTAALINALVKAGKPHRVQMYPSERHSLRRLEASEHYETMLLSFLQKSL